MARDFSRNASNYASFGVAAINPVLSGAAVVSVAGWVWADAINPATNDNRLFVVFINAGSSGVSLSLHDGTSAVLRVLARSAPADALQTRNGTTALATGQWHHVGAEINFAAGTITPRVNGAAENGGSVAFGAASYTPGTPTSNDMMGASWGAGVPAEQLDGGLAEWGFWLRALSAGEWSALARGASPRRLSARLHYPMLGSSGNVNEMVRGGPHATVVGTVGWRAHAPVSPPYGSDAAPVYAAATPPPPSGPGARSGLLGDPLSLSGFLGA
jgi:hypothetical protein